MKITKKNLEKIIKEELEALLSEEPQKYFSRTRNKLVSVDRPHPEDIRSREFVTRSQVDMSKSPVDRLDDLDASPGDLPPGLDGAMSGMGDNADMMGSRRRRAPLATKDTTKAEISPKAKAKITLDSDGNQVYDFKKGMTIRGTKPKTKAKISPKAGQKNK